MALLFDSMPSITLASSFGSPKLLAGMACAPKRHDCADANAYNVAATPCSSNRGDDCSPDICASPIKYTSPIRAFVVLKSPDIKSIKLLATGLPSLSNCAYTELPQSTNDSASVFASHTRFEGFISPCTIGCGLMPFL